MVKRDFGKKSDGKTRNDNETDKPTGAPKDKAEPKEVTVEAKPEVKSAVP